MDEKLTGYEKWYIDTIVEHTRLTRDTAEGVSGWGGNRPGAGRKPTGRKRQQIYVTDEEFTKIKEFIDQLRSIEKELSK